MGCQESTASNTARSSGNLQQGKYSNNIKSSCNQTEEQTKGDGKGAVRGSSSRNVAAADSYIDMTSNGGTTIFDVATTKGRTAVTTTATTPSGEGSLFSFGEDIGSSSRMKDGGGKVAPSLSRQSSLHNVSTNASPTATGEGAVHRQGSQRRKGRSPASPNPHHVFRRTQSSVLLVVEEECLDDISMRADHYHQSILPPHTVGMMNDDDQQQQQPLGRVTDSDINNHHHSLLLPAAAATAKLIPAVLQNSSISSNPLSSSLGGGGATTPNTIDQQQQQHVLHLSRSFNGVTLSASANNTLTTTTPKEMSSSLLLEMSHLSHQQHQLTATSSSHDNVAVPLALINTEHHPTLPIGISSSTLLNNNINNSPHHHHHHRSHHQQQQQLDPNEIMDAFLLERKTYSPGYEALEPEISPASLRCQQSLREEEESQAQQQQLLTTKFTTGFTTTDEGGRVVSRSSSIAGSVENESATSEDQKSPLPLMNENGKEERTSSLPSRGKKSHYLRPDELQSVLEWREKVVCSSEEWHRDGDSHVS